MKLLLVASVLACVLKASKVNANVFEYQPQLECLMVQFEHLCKDDSECADQEGWSCFFGDDTLYNIEGLSSDIVLDLKSAETILSVTGATKSKGTKHKPPTLNIPPGALVSTKHIAKGKWKGKQKLRHRQRQLAVPNEGNSTILIVRVSDSFGDAPPHNATELSNHILGTGSDLHNLQSQYDACSGGKLQFFPALGENIVDGVGELIITGPVSDVNSRTVESWVDTALPARFPDWNQYTHIMYVFPKSVKFGGAAAFAYLNWYKSVYMAGYATKILVGCHEIAHNLNKHHSGKRANGDPYGDFTGYLGNAAQQDDFPCMCFNAAKSWSFGWYSETEKEGHLTLPAGAISWDGKLVGIHDYMYSNAFVHRKHRVIARIVSPTTLHDDLYVMYNRKEGVNFEVVEGGDTVTIVSTSALNKQSWLEAAITEETVGGHRVDDWDGNGNALVVEVCERVFGAPDYAQVMVYTDDGVNNLQCSDLPLCAEDTEFCESDTDCCSDLACNNLDSSCYTPPPCAPETDFCESDTDCCEGVCFEGSCTMCSALATESCTAEADCCEGVCFEGSCSMCSALAAEACSAPGECCEGGCDGGFCSTAAPSCTGLMDKESCNDGVDCCSGVCSGGGKNGKGQKKCVGNSPSEIRTKKKNH